MRKKLNSFSKISVFSVAMITMTSVDSIRNLPGSSLFGSHAIFFFILVGICYFIPVALVCAELSTTYPEQGGVYLWGKKTLGRNFGFVSLWYQYAENVVFYPPLITFIIAAGVYPFFPSLVKNNVFMFILINVIFWSVTLVNILGLKFSALFTNVLGLLGMVFPMFLICGLGIYWYFSQSISFVHFSSVKDWIPDVSNMHIGAAFTAVVLSLTGMEITTSYANEVKNPQKSYPKALFIATFFILLTLALGSISIASVVPAESSTLSSGVESAFAMFFNQLHMHWMIVVISICIVLGGLAGLNNWIIAPTKGLHTAAKDGYLPKLFHRENKNKAPVALLMAQGVVVSLLSLMFVFVPNVNNDMWIMNILMTQLYMIMYVCVFLSFFASRFLDKSRKRPFKVPGGRFGVFTITILGVVSCIITILLSFNLPAGMSAYNGGLYLIIGLIIFSLPAIVGIAYRIFTRRRRKKLLSSSSCRTLFSEGSA